MFEVPLPDKTDTHFRSSNRKNNFPKPLIVDLKRRSIELCLRRKEIKNVYIHTLQEVYSLKGEIYCDCQWTDQVYILIDEPLDR